MSKDRNIDDAELANISGAGDKPESDLASNDGTGGAKDFEQAPDPGVPGDPTNPNTDDQGGGENTFG